MNTEQHFHKKSLPNVLSEWTSRFVLAFKNRAEITRGVKRWLCQGVDQNCGNQQTDPDQKADQAKAVLPDLQAF